MRFLISILSDPPRPRTLFSSRGGAYGRGVLRTLNGRIVAVAIALCGLVPCAAAAETVLVGTDVAAAERVSLGQVDHAPWEALLSRYVNDKGQVAYAAWKQSGADVQRLDDYLAALSAGDPSKAADPSAVLAFWINAYNAVTVRGILREYPTSSIRNHTAKLFGYNIWDDLQLSVAGKRHSLNQIEHDLLRKMNEPRIHFAIVCASVGCPRLIRQAYTAERLESQLQSNSLDFFSHQQNFRYDAATKTFHLSSILKWFGEDFGNDPSAQLRRIAAWLPDDVSRSAATSADVRVKFLDYDWSLNSQ